MQKKRKKKKIIFNGESKKFDWNEKSHEMLKLRLAPFYNDLFSEGKREKER